MPVILHAYCRYHSTHAQVPKLLMNKKRAYKILLHVWQRSWSRARRTDYAQLKSWLMQSRSSRTIVSDRIEVVDAW